MKHTLHPFCPDPDQPPLLSIARDDGYNWIIGEDDVDDLLCLLNRYKAGEHDGEIDDLDPRRYHNVDDANSTWISVGDAARYYGIHRQTVYDAIEHEVVRHRLSSNRKFVWRADAEARWGKKK